jgi:leucyl aminopeptidase
MNFELKSLDLVGAATDKSDVVVVLVASSFKPGKDVFSPVIAHAIKAGDLETKPGKLLHLYRLIGVSASRVILVGMGDGSPKQVRQAVSAAVGAIKSVKGVSKLTLCFTSPLSSETVGTAVVAVADASYVYTATKSKPEGRNLRDVVVGVPDASGLKPVLDQAVATIHGIELAKEWGNRPANHATPAMLGHAAKALAKMPKIKCEVMGPKQVEKLGMGSFMAVAKGSEEELRFIVLHYTGAPSSEPPVVLIGKGITFDTGGISLKPAAEMDEMKFDMCGAASVLGVFRALSELKPEINVVGLIPSCENMGNGQAIKPGDVVTSMSGQTIEVLNTDAEGRLILCDALTYAERFKPSVVVDIATLTGACVVALGGVRSGMFANSDELANQLLAAGEAALDPCWRMPLDDDYAEGLKTSFADVANVGGRAGGAITAAKFLQRFAGKFTWAHLDIAGTGWKSGATKGATGRPVGLLIDFLLSRSKAVAPGSTKSQKRVKKASA